MKDKISVLIVDDNVEFGDLMNEYISEEEDISIIGVARDGLQALELIQTLTPDVVILDIIMPNLDGIGVLEKLSSLKLGRRPIFIVLSAIGQDVFVQKAITLGAEYYIVKPFDIDILISRIRQMYKEKESFSFTQSRIRLRANAAPGIKAPEPVQNLEAVVTSLMHDVGIPPHMTGYQYIREAIIQTINYSKLFAPITKVLYPAVAQKFNSTPQRVERAIRNAIESAWGRSNPDAIDSLFGYAAKNNNGKPTNSEFVAMMADKVRIIMGIK